MSTDYDKDLINREVVAICDHYLTNRRGEGRRQTYLCPVCGDRNFEVDPRLGYAGCFDAACEVPRSTDAVAIIAYFEGKSLSGEGFVMCLKKGYEILGIADPEDEEQRHGSTNGDRPKAMTARKEKAGQRQKAMTPRAGRESEAEGVSENGASGFHSSSPQWGAATSSPPEASNTMLTEQPVQAWQENEDGTTVPVAAVVMREPEPEAEPEDAEEVEEAELTEESRLQTEKTDDRQTAHEVFEELLRLCRREERDEAFLIGRGLDEAAIEEGRFGSISKSRANAVISRLRKKFSDEELLSVPGFRKAESGQMRFSLYGDYTLMPYYDGEGYIRTVEGRFTGEEMGEYDKKYKALLNSAVHLYVHPRYKPDEVVAICEGAIGAMVAARYGFAVAAIKGMRNYRCRVDGDGNLYTILPELEGVDFAGKVVIYIPDLDVKPQTREEAFSLVPEACQWMIERQGGIPKVAMLPEGAKDLDAWILSLDEEDREQKIAELLDRALPLEQWKQQYLATEQPDLSGEEEGVQAAGQRTEYVGEDGSPVASSAEEGSSESEPESNSEEQTEHGSSQRLLFGEPEPPADKHTSPQESDPAEAQQPLDGFEGVRDTTTNAAANATAENHTGQNTKEDGEPKPGRREYGREDGEGLEPDKRMGEDQGEGSAKGGLDTGGDEPSADEGTPPDEEHARSQDDEDDTAEMTPVGGEPEYSGTSTAALEVAGKGEWALATVVYVVAAVILTILIHIGTGRYIGFFEFPLWWEAGLAAFIAIWVTVGVGKLRKERKAKRLRLHIEGPNDE